MVGKYLTDTVGFSLSGSVPYMRGMPPFATAGYGAHLYIPWWKADRHNELDFPLGYHVELGGGGFATPALGFGAQAYEQSQGYGLPMKKAIRDVVRKRDQCQFHRPRIDGAERGLLLRDRSGWREGQVGHSGPALPLEMERLRAERGAPHARKLHGDHRDDGRDRQRGRGTRTRRGAAPPAPTQPPDNRPQLGAGGGIIHEVGCVRMGTNPDNSVVNRFCQVHEVPNVFSADGGPFASHGDKNPTHTIIALAWRTAEYLAEEMRKGNV